MADPLPFLWQAFEKARFSGTGTLVARRLLTKYLDESGLKLEKRRVGESNVLMLVSERMSIDIPLSIGMAVHSLRSALDTAVSALMARATGKTDARVNFPMHETERELRASFDVSKRTCPSCGFTSESKGANNNIRTHLPELEKLIVDQFRPWQDVSGRT